MNKKFMSMIVCSMMLTAGLGTTLTSCSDDHDEDITNLKGQTAELSKQLAALQAALSENQNAAKQAADAATQALALAQDAAKKGDAAVEEAQKAAAEAELAKKAAAEAKAEAIKEVMAELKPLIDAASALSAENAAAIAALAGRIDGIEKGLMNIDLSDVNKQLGAQADAIAANAAAIQALQTQVAALENMKAELAGLSSAVAGMNSKIATIEQTIAELKSLEADVQANKKGIEDIRKDLTDLAAKVSQDISNCVNTLAGVLAQRLTSVTLMPSLYVGGIPTIEFESAKYTKLVLKNGVWTKATTGKTEFIVSNNTAEAQYRLNPGTVTESDIKANDLAYVTKVATTRAAEAYDAVVHVASANVSAPGVLTVKLGKSNTESLNLPGNDIYTVSLRVPIADKHLFTDQGETEAAVYSEFTRLEESYFTPELAFVPGQYTGQPNVTSHLNDSTTLYQSAAGKYICKDIVYSDKDFDLYTLVDGCKFVAPSSHKEMTRAQLKTYGFDIVFHVATKAYTPSAPDQTDQQKFVKLSGENNSLLTPVATNGETGNKVIIGKQPIIRAELRDVTNNNVIDVRYFKVRFTAEKTEPVVVDWGLVTSAGNACTGAEIDFTWKDMAEKVLMKIGSNGMSKDEFTKIYGDVAPLVTPANDQNGTLNAFMIPGNLDASIPVMTWTLTSEQLGKLTAGDNTVTMTKSVTFTDPNGVYPSVTINLKWTVTTKITAATLGNTDPLKWQNNTMKVYPVPMKLNAAGKWDGVQAYYATNILEGRMQPYVNNLLSCAHFDVDLSAADKSKNAFKALTFTAGFSHWSMTAANQNNLKEVIFSIENNANGKNIVSNGGKVTLAWSYDVNGLNIATGFNRQQFATSYLQIVKILDINTVLGKDIVDNSVAQTINIANSFALTDAYGNLVAKVATASAPLAADYYQFYGVQDPKFGTNIYIADNAEGTQNKRFLESLNMVANINNTTGELTFQNNGAPLQANAYIIVPVTVEHLWGTLTGNIAVPLKKSSAPLNVRK